MNIQAGFVSRSRQGILLESSQEAALQNVTLSHVSVTQSNQHSVVFAAPANTAGCLFQDVTVRINFEVSGGASRPNTASSGVLFRDGTPTLNNTRVIIQAVDPAQFLGTSRWVALATATPHPVANFRYQAELWVGGFRPPGLFLTGNFRDSLLYFFSTGGHWEGDIVNLGANSSGNVISAGCVASGDCQASIAW